MTDTLLSGARPRPGRPRHTESPRARVRAERTVEDTGCAATRVAGTQLTSVVEVDLTGVAPDDVLAAVVTTAVRSIEDHPSVTGRVDPATGAVVRTEGVHVAVLGDDGTTVAFVENAHDLTAAAVARQLVATPDDGRGHTFDVIDTGSWGALLDTPALGEDRATVLGIGAVVRRPVVMASGGGEVIVVRAMAHLSLSYDPRLVGGAVAARFLHSVRQAIEEGVS